MTEHGEREARLREGALGIFRAGVEAANPRVAVGRHLTHQGDALLVEGMAGAVRVPLPSPNRGRILVVGAGKGSGPMASAVEEILGDRITQGLVCVKDGHGCPLQRIALREASHPVPDQRGVEAGAEIRALVAGATADDLIISVISGGGSALLTLPAAGVTLKDIQVLTGQLLACGASIDEINTLRKHVSRVKGGQLARAAHPAPVINLMLSDVVGDPPDVIASGPFSPDGSTFEQAREILDRYGIWNAAPSAVREIIEQGCSGRIPDTPKDGDPAFARVVQAVVGSNGLSLAAAAREAEALGYDPLVLSSMIQGEAREVARVFAAMVKQSRLNGLPKAPPACILAGGETTVTLRGDGTGGRNQELALALALDLQGLPGVIGLSGGTDGNDGPTDAAGAFALGDTVSRARARGLDPRDYLARNDSYHFFAALGDLVKTGPTRTNVMDIQVLLIDPE
jgi:hydroxypyruvate reductase